MDSIWEGVIGENERKRTEKWEELRMLNKMDREMVSKDPGQNMCSDTQ